MKATRKTEAGEIATSFPLGYQPGGSGSVEAGPVPFEKLLAPGAVLEVVHAEIGQDGHEEFDPDEVGDFTPDPDKRYKVKTYSGSITVPDGSEEVPDSDPQQYNFYAKTTTDNRVITYVLAYSNIDTEDEPDGWHTEETGERTTGERFIFATDEVAPDTTEIEGETVSATVSKEGATVYDGDGITVTLSDPVTIDDLQAYCEAKLDDLKDRADDEPEPPDEDEDDEEEEDPEEPEPDPVVLENKIESFRTEDLSLKMASARMVWTGSAMFDSLAGELKYFEDWMMPDFALTAGSWKMEVSDEIPATDRYYDALGLFGESAWWDDDFSLFGSVDFSFLTPQGAIYPKSGIDAGAPFTKQHIRWVCIDGEKRRIIVEYPNGGEEMATVTLETSKRNGFASATDWLEMQPTGGFPNAFVTKVERLQEGGDPVVEYDPSADPPVTLTVKTMFTLQKARQFTTWGYRGFTALIPPEGDDPPPEPLEKYYQTLTISSTSLRYAAQDDDTPPTGLTGLSATGDMSGSHTLTRPDEWKLGTLDMAWRFSKASPDDASPFKLTWSAAEKSGQWEIRISNVGGFVMVTVPPITGETSITETSYQMTADAPDPLPVRSYRYSWPRRSESPSPEPTVKSEDFTLDAPAEEGAKRQVSAWVDIGLPTAGKSFSSDPDDEFSCRVGV